MMLESGPRSSAKTCAALAVLSLSAAACSPEPATQPAAPPISNSAAAPSAPAPAPAPPAGTAATTPAAAAPLTAEGWGPLRVGMTLAEITAALGPDANPDAAGGADPASCDEFRPARAPEGMLLMVEDGRLSRISLIRASRVKTDRGLGLGAAPAEVRAVYGSALQATPHKYVDAPAQYLTFWSVGGSATGSVPRSSRGIRYEVDATGKVTTIHAGGPSIAYVEGCS